MKHEYRYPIRCFTMAEILISLTIIGVIAAITLPSLRDNINEKTWATQRKALYSRMSQAISMLPSLNGYGIGATDAETASKATQAFISEGLSKVLKINNICAAPDGADATARRDAYTKCGFPKKFTKMGTNSKLDTPTKLTGLNSYFNKTDDFVSYSQIDTQAAAFETANGESILTFYSPNCSYAYAKNSSTFSNYYSNLQLMQPTMCANFVYDLNGRKGPNKVGKDIGFMTAFYPTDSQIAMPSPVADISVSDDGNHPKFSIGYGNSNCRKLYGDDTRMANIEELKSIFVNNSLGFNARYNKPIFAISDAYHSSTITSNEKLNILDATTGGILVRNISVYSSGKARIFCVK